MEYKQIDTKKPFEYLSSNGFLEFTIKTLIQKRPCFS